MSDSIPLPTCKIPANPDIAGVGVRASVYIQATLVIIHSFLVESGNKPNPSGNGAETAADPTSTIGVSLEHGFDRISHLMDPKISKEADRTFEFALFITGWALVIAALWETYSNKGSDTGLDDYHALIVLNLGFLNYWAGFNLLTRRIEQKENSFVPFPSKGKVKKTIGSWVPFYIHSTMFSLLGILFWLDQGPFLDYANPPSDPAPTCQGAPPVYYWAFRPIPITSRPLKIISLIFYFASVLPVLNGVITYLISLIASFLIVCVATFVTMVLLVVFFVVSFPLACFKATLCRDSDDKSRFIDRLLGIVHKMLHGFSRLHRRATTVIYTGPIIYWIVATEMLVQSNKAVLEEDDESKWTFGQFMALMTACIAVGLYALQVIETYIAKKGEEKRQRQDDEKVNSETNQAQAEPTPTTNSVPDLPSHSLTTFQPPVYPSSAEISYFVMSASQASVSVPIPRASVHESRHTFAGSDEPPSMPIPHVPIPTPNASNDQFQPCPAPIPMPSPEVSMPRAHILVPEPTIPIPFPVPHNQFS